MMKKIRNLTIATVAVMMTIVSVLYINDFRYNSEDGLCYIVKRGSDYTEEERKEKHISENYEFRFTHINDLETIMVFLKR